MLLQPTNSSCPSKTHFYCFLLYHLDVEDEVHSPRKAHARLLRCPILLHVDRLLHNLPRVELLRLPFKHYHYVDSPFSVPRTCLDPFFSICFESLCISFPESCRYPMQIFYSLGTFSLRKPGISIALGLGRGKGEAGLREHGLPSALLVLRGPEPCRRALGKSRFLGHDELPRILRPANR